MSLLRRFDVWAGVRLFHPPIILLCQLTRQTQYAVSKELWLAAILFALSFSEPGWQRTVLIAIGAFQTLAAGLSADVPTPALGVLRFWLWSMALSHVPVVIFMGEWNVFLMDIMVLFAEYALTIKTIPPRKKKHRQRGGVLASKSA